MTPEARRRSFRELAARLDGVDVEAYRTSGADPLDPVLGEGDPRARVCIFGRDPGRHEVEHGQPFVGAGGQKVRQGLHRVLHGTVLPDFQASLDVGRHVFWANTVPYKPLKNKAWSRQVVADFAPLVRDLIVHGWQGTDVLALGRGAFDWFATSREERARLAAVWASDEAFTSTVEVEVAAPDGASRVLRVHPLPHPSPLNATWASRFPALFEGRLRSLELSVDSWQIAAPSARAAHG